MRKLLLLMGLSMLGVLMFASVATAQGAGPGGEGPCTGTPFEQYLPEVNGCVTTEGLPNPGTAIVYDADTREPIGTLDEVSEGLDDGTSSATPSPTASPTATPTATASSSAAPAVQYQYSAALPDTGGVSPATLLAIVPAILLVGGGLLSAGLIRRR